MKKFFSPLVKTDKVRWTLERCIVSHFSFHTTQSFISTFCSIHTYIYIYIFTGFSNARVTCTPLSSWSVEKSHYHQRDVNLYFIFFPFPWGMFHTPWHISLQTKWNRVANSYVCIYIYIYLDTELSMCSR